MSTNLALFELSRWEPVAPGTFIPTVAATILGFPLFVVGTQNLIWPPKKGEKKKFDVLNFVVWAAIIMAVAPVLLIILLLIITKVFGLGYTPE